MIGVHRQTLRNRRGLRFVLKEIHGHERRRVFLTDFGAVNLDAHQPKLENVFARRQIRQIIHGGLGGHILGLLAGANSLRLGFLHHRATATNLRLEGGNLPLSAIELVFVRLYLFEQALVHFVRTRLLLGKRSAQVVNLLLLKLQQSLRLAKLLNLIAEGLAQPPKLGAQRAFIHPVIDDGHLRVVHRVVLKRGAAHVHEHANLLVRRFQLNLHAGAVHTQAVPLVAGRGSFFQTTVTDGLDGAPEFHLANLGVSALSLRLRHQRSQLAHF
mmetsp:Transcript_2510/g.8764  ORF Transcript_2510/g.8764 Transcript_2510/m.8764 type:complete len:271 (+) Transcript_2510:6178-6990(+)